MHRLKTIEWADGAVRIIDQTRLPASLAYERIDRIEVMHEAIRQLRVRGAPAIGIAAAFGLYLGIKDAPDTASGGDILALVRDKAEFLLSARPTAVNLSWALDRIKSKASELVKKNTPAHQIKNQLFREALAVLEEDRQMCRRIGEHGLALLKGKKTILTHCNAGGLAASEYGTALAPVYLAAEQGRLIHVYADETRPLLQGARLTGFELLQAGIPVTLICDSMAATVMARGLVDAVFVGADRIAGNGDTANKVGTYGVAILAHAHKIPFYVAAPASTFDMSIASGKEIPIEERHGSEITHGFGVPTAPAGIKVFNPAFDVTPAHLITSFITDRGVITPPFRQNFKAAGF
ncbi:MAG: S-methyl-5-thioribose-1-phosphate isomerase [Chitinispirillaceae bacterium]|nr:S-methyl-5-thioribose-1-phosphate isomerase [Chitinispirillaceae bacterium]